MQVCSYLCVALKQVYCNCCAAHITKYEGDLVGLVVRCCCNFVADRAGVQELRLEWAWACEVFLLLHYGIGDFGYSSLHAQGCTYVTDFTAVAICTHIHLIRHPLGYSPGTAGVLQLQRTARHPPKHPSLSILSSVRQAAHQKVRQRCQHTLFPNTGLCRQQEYVSMGAFSRMHANTHPLVTQSR